MLRLLRAFHKINEIKMLLKAISLDSHSRQESYIEALARFPSAKRTASVEGSGAGSPALPPPPGFALLAGLNLRPDLHLRSEPRFSGGKCTVMCLFCRKRIQNSREHCENCFWRLRSVEENIHVGTQSKQK